MKRFALFVILLCNISVLSAQDVENKYLVGAVPETNGKVTFRRSIPINKDVLQYKLFDLISKWANEEFGEKKDSKRSIILEKRDENYIACKGDDQIFTTGLFGMEKVFMTYQLILRVEVGSVDLEFRGIKYYSVGENKEILLAEKMITDKIALSKDGSKINSYYNSYRISTIDHINAVEQNLLQNLTLTKKEDLSVAPTTSIVEIKKEEALPTPAPSVQVPDSPAMSVAMTIINEPTPSVTAVASTSMVGYKSIDAEQIPGNIVKLLKDSWSLITSGKGEKTNVMTASWGGLGRFWDKPVSMCFLNPTRHSIATMNDGETYTISFYTEMYRDKLTYCGSTSGKNTDKIKGSGLTPIITPSGATAFSEAWMIIECRKIIAQPISESAVKDKKVGEKWSKDGYHTMFMGEILNVWVK